jgi:enediyne biosynthesis protein E7
MSTAPEVTIHRSLTKALKLFDDDRLRWLDEACALGPLVALRMGPIKLWVVTDAEVARDLLVTDGASWTRPPATLAPIRVAVGENLFTASDKEWAKVQPFVAPAFRRKALEPRLAGIGALIQDDVDAIPLDRTIDLEATMGRIALRLAAQVLLGAELDPSRADEIAHNQRSVVRWIGIRLGQLSGFVPVAVGAAAREMKQRRAVLDAYADEVIAHAQASGDAVDTVLGALLAARPSGSPLSPEQLRSHVLGLFLAGNETTAAALSWAVVHGAAAPEEWSKMRADPDRHTTAFLTESLRLNPAVWGIPRTPNKPGVMLTAGAVTTRVRRGQLANIYLRGINRDPNIWDDPLRFDPSRHGSDAKETRRALLPFGLGARGCIGQHVALAEMIAVLPALADRGDVAIDGSAPEDPGFALRVRGGLTGRFTASKPRGATELAAEPGRS